MFYGLRKFSGDESASFLHKQKIPTKLFQTVIVNFSGIKKKFSLFFLFCLFIREGKKETETNSLKSKPGEIKEAFSEIERGYVGRCTYYCIIFRLVLSINDVATYEFIPFPRIIRKRRRRLKRKKIPPRCKLSNGHND